MFYTLHVRLCALNAIPRIRQQCPLWRFQTPQLARTSRQALLEAYARFCQLGHGTQFLQMGSTRARRYANHRSGRKYDGPYQLNTVVRVAFGDAPCCHPIQIPRRPSQPLFFTRHTGSCSKTRFIKFCEVCTSSVTNARIRHPSLLAARPAIRRSESRNPPVQRHLDFYVLPRILRNPLALHWRLLPLVG